MFSFFTFFVFSFFDFLMFFSFFHFSILIFSIFIFEKCVASFFLVPFFSSKFISLLASVSEFNCRCFLRSRCSMEMWCLDDTGRNSWIGLDHLLGREHDELPRVGRKLLACQNGTSPDCVIVVVLVFVTG